MDIMPPSEPEIEGSMSIVIISLSRSSEKYAASLKVTPIDVGAPVEPMTVHDCIVPVPNEAVSP